MSDSIEMNYYEPETTTWTVNLDGRYMSAVQNYLLADGIPLEGVTRIVSNAAQMQLKPFRIVLIRKETAHVKKLAL